MALINGHAYAGGLFLALCHDFRIIAPKSKVWFSELHVNVGFGNAYNELATSLLDIGVARHTMFGAKIRAPQALEYRIA